MEQYIYLVVKLTSETRVRLGSRPSFFLNMTPTNNQHRKRIQGLFSIIVKIFASVELIEINVLKVTKRNS